MKEVEEDKARLVREAKVEAAKKKKAAEEEKQAVLRLMEEQATAVTRAETKRLIDLQLTKAKDCMRMVKKYANVKGK